MTATAGELTTTKTVSFTCYPDPEVLDLFFGGNPVEHSGPAVSLIFDHAELVDGRPTEPTPPPRERGLWARLTGREAKAMRQYHRDYVEFVIELIEWHNAGCPPKEQTIRTYIPRARLTSD